MPKPENKFISNSLGGILSKIFGKILYSIQFLSQIEFNISRNLIIKPKQQLK